MRKNKLLTLFVGVASVFAIGLTSCGGGSGGGSGTPIEAIYLNKYEIDLLPNETYTLDVTVDPEDAMGYKLDWSSSDTTIATVKGGVITAVGSGDATITVKVRNQDVSESCLVHVAETYHDYVTDGSVKLSLDYNGHNFWTDGVEQVTLMTPIDGDTAHFKTSQSGPHGTTLKCRFWGIDTPESTGKVQPWGYEASDFTKQKLNEAKAKGTIVVSSPKDTYGAPDPDSTGSRYVSLIWVNLEKKNAPLNELYLLNLWVVQEGFSMPKNISSIEAYEDTFNDAYHQAQVYKKNMWSGEKPPHWNDGDYQDISLLDIKREVEATFADPTHVNKYDNEKVRFTGVVSSYSDGTLYVQEFYPESDDDPTVGEWAGINIFCGMAEISTIFTKPNTYLQVYGLCKDSETFGFQITDTQGHWKPVPISDTDCRVLLDAEENTEEHSLYTFHKTAAELNTASDNKDCEFLFCSIAVSGTLSCTSAFVSDDRAITLTFAGMKWNVYIPYAYYGDPEKPNDRWDEKTDFEGKSFRLDLGTYAWHKQTSGKIVFQIIPTSVDSFVWVK